jgi:hypothetical protein
MRNMVSQWDDCRLVLGLVWYMPGQPCWPASVQLWVYHLILSPLSMLSTTSRPTGDVAGGLGHPYSVRTMIYHSWTTQCCNWHQIIIAHWSGCWSDLRSSVQSVWSSLAPFQYPACYSIRPSCPNWALPSYCFISYVVVCLCQSPSWSLVGLFCLSLS